MKIYQIDSSARKEGSTSRALAKKLLDWAPNRTIHDACLDGWNWITKNPNGFN